MHIILKSSVVGVLFIVVNVFFCSFCFCCDTAVLVDFVCGLRFLKLFIISVVSIFVIKWCLKEMISLFVRKTFEGYTSAVWIVWEEIQGKRCICQWENLWIWSYLVNLCDAKCSRNQTTESLNGYSIAIQIHFEFEHSKKTVVVFHLALSLFFRVCSKMW